MASNIPADVTLATGAVIKHEPRTCNGATIAYVADEPERSMTDSEWSEYCAIIVKRNKAERRNAARRMRDQVRRDCGLVRVRGALGGVYWSRSKLAAMPVCA